MFSVVIPFVVNQDVKINGLFANCIPIYEQLSFHLYKLLLKLKVVVQLPGLLQEPDLFWRGDCLVTDNLVCLNKLHL